MKGLMIASLFALIFTTSASRAFAYSIGPVSPTNPSPGLPCTQRIEIL